MRRKDATEESDGRKRWKEKRKKERMVGSEGNEGENETMEGGRERMKEAKGGDLGNIFFGLEAVRV